MAAEVNSGRTARIQALMDDLGLNKRQVAKRSSLSYSGFYHIYEGKPTSRLQQVADVLGTTAQYLENGHDGLAIEKLSVYSLEDAPLCTTPYRLRLSSDNFRRDGMPIYTGTGEVVALVGPCTESNLHTARFGLFRRSSEKRAIVVHLVDDGDRVVMFPSGTTLGIALSPGDELQDAVHGELLGTILDVLHAPFAFQRKS